MKNRCLIFCTACSSIVFCLTFGLWLLAGSLEPRKQFVSLTRRFHVSVDARGFDARLEFFNDAEYGPYSGSIIGLAGDPNGPRVVGFGDTAGIYYRLIRWPNGTSLWTLSLSLLYPLIASAALPIAWMIRIFRSTRCGAVE